jgi:AraC-like DNA-binding protein
MPGAVSIPPGPARPADAYVEYAPPASLAPHVECFWSRSSSHEPTGAPRPHRVLPDGCVDIVVGFDARRSAAVESGVALSALAVGAMTKPLVFADAPNASFLGVRFRPGAAGVLFGIPVSELTDERVPLAYLWRESEALCEGLAGAPDTVGRIRTLSASIARRLLAAPGGPPPAVLTAAARIVAARGDLSIQGLATELGVTRQHLARSFGQHVGLSPKMFARIMRARGVLKRARGRADVDWSSIALDAGYYDQSHLIAELKELTGLAPGAWAAGGS